MKFPRLKRSAPANMPTPAKLSMDDYLDYQAELLKALDLDKAYRYKRSEAHIKTPFKIRRASAPAARQVEGQSPG